METRNQMSLTTTKILIADGTGSTADAIATFLKGDRAFEVIGRATTGDECLNMSVIKHPDVVMIHSDLKQPSAIEVCEQLTSENPNTSVLMMLTTGFDEDLFGRMMGASVAGFAFCPLQRDRTLDMIREAAEKTERRSHLVTLDPQEEDRPRVITVVGSRGGSGRTTIAANLACAIAKAAATKRKNNRVILVDANVPGGDAAAFLNMNPQRTLLDFLPKATVIDNVMVESLLENHPSGMMFLAAAGSETGDQMELPRGVLLHVLTHLRRRFLYTVVDMPEAATEASRAVLDFSDDVLLVVGVDLPRLEAARVFLARLLDLNFSRGKVHVVLNNKEPASSDIPTADAEEVLGFRAAARLPYDKSAVSTAINLGKPFVLDQPDKPVACAIHDLACSLGIIGRRESGRLAAFFKTSGLHKALRGVALRTSA